MKLHVVKLNIPLNNFDMWLTDIDTWNFNILIINKLCYHVDVDKYIKTNKCTKNNNVEPLPSIGQKFNLLQSWWILSWLLMWILTCQLHPVPHAQTLHLAWWVDQKLSQIGRNILLSCCWWTQMPGLEEQQMIFWDIRFRLHFLYHTTERKVMKHFKVMYSVLQFLQLLLHWTLQLLSVT